MLLRFPYYSWLHPDEEILILKRRHWYVLLTRLAWPVVLTLAGLVGVLALGLGTPLSDADLVLLTILLPLPGFLWLVWRFLDWENDQYIVTNHRVMQIDRVYFIRERRLEANLDRIQDVKINKPSLIHNVLDFGDLSIQTAGTSGNIIFESIGRPGQTQTRIFSIVAAAQHDTTGGLDYTPPPASAGQPGSQNEKTGIDALWEALVALFIVPTATLGRNPIIYRKHWIILLMNELGPVTALILWLVGLIVRFLLTPPLTAFGVPVFWLWVVYLLLIIPILGWMAWQYIDWYNDLYVLSEDRIIDIEKTPLQKEERREANFGVIQDVRSAKPNPIAQLLDFGHVIVETAGEAGAFTFMWVAQPQQVQNVVFERVRAFRERQAREQREQRLNETRELVRSVLAEQHTGGL